MDTRKIEELTFICTTDGKTPFFKDLTQIKDEDNGNIYGLVSPITHATRDIWSAHAVRLGDEVLLDVQRRMPTLASMSLDELRERIYVDHPMSTRVLDIYTASFQDGAEALVLAQAFFDALCEVFTAKTNVDTPVMVSIPALLE